MHITPELRAAINRVRNIQDHQRANYHDHIQRFADANSWRSSKWFSLDLLIRNKMHDGNSLQSIWGHRNLGRMFDHPNFFRRNRRPVAIVVHNYPGTVEQLRLFMKGRDDLILHEPEAGPKVSWYYAGSAWPMCVTRPDVKEVVWPTAADVADSVKIAAALYAARQAKDALWRDAEQQQKAAAG
jgi:hypothetical protein